MANNDAEIPSNTIKNPDHWTTGGEPMTGAQSSYLHTLAEQADQPEVAEGDLTKAEASKRIEQLREEVGLADDRESSAKTGK
jgi:hypothetical protein